MDSFDKLSKRALTLGNHYQKYLFTIKRYKDSLIQALESSGKLMQIHLWRSSLCPAEEMKIIINLSEDDNVKIQHLSCYYSLQFIYLNFRNSDILELEITSGISPTEAYYHFMMQIGNDFRELSRAYIENLLNIYIPKENRPEFFISSVGTRADQDDIDVGIITADDCDVEELNMAFQKITQHMLVYATKLHLYLSENVGKDLYTTTISEYDSLLSKQIQDVVIISELLNAKIILGSQALFDKFQETIISRYFYNPKKNVRFHEGFLRGILGEMRSLLISPLKNDAISPKYDSLRILKSIICAKKTIYNVQEVNAWDIINILIEKEPHLKPEYELLFKAVSFLEMFKFLLQMYVVQEETHRMDEIDPSQLAFIAQKMGYMPIGTVEAWDQLIIDYYRYVKEVRKLCDFLLEDVTKHLSSISIFVKILKSPKYQVAGGRSKRVLAKEFIDKMHFFAGAKYWEDVLILLQSDQNILNTFVNGFEELDETVKNDVITGYVEWAQFSPITVIRLISILGKKQKNIFGDTIFLRMNLKFLQYIEKMPRTAERLSRIFSHYPQYIHEYFQYVPELHFEYLDRILEKPVFDYELKVFQLQLKELCNIHKWSSKYFHRFFSRVISNYPKYLKSLTSITQLSKISSGLFAMVDVQADYIQKKVLLGDYYDLEFLRVGIGTLRGVDLSVTNRDFTNFCDNYLRKLFDICTEEVGRDISSELPSTDTFAVLAAGGHARRQAYDDDYDLIAIVDTDDDEVIQYATRIVTRMNREILKRGLLPHYRLGEILGGFVNPISQIIEYLSSDDEENFIDLSQLLGARMIIGGEVMESVVKEKILDRFIFEKKPFYINRMIEEIQDRQSKAEKCSGEACNLKETIGGLRDIEAVTLILKAYLGITYPISEDFLLEMKIYFPDITEELDILLHSVHVLRTIRNLYRITEAAEDNIQRGYLSRLAAIFKQSNHPEWGDSDLIFKRINDTLEQSAVACSKVIQFLKSHIK
jgi:hypothetical protein